MKCANCDFEITREPGKGWVIAVIELRNPNYIRSDSYRITCSNGKPHAPSKSHYFNRLYEKLNSNNN